MAELETYWTVEEIAENLKVDQETVRRWLQDGKLKGVKVGKNWRVSTDALAEFIKN
jgi:excisionase family DNA binding protein